MADAPVEQPTSRDRGASSFLVDTVTTWQFALAIIVIFGALLRFHGLDWDKPSGSATPLQMHPDERFLSFVANDIDWPSSPAEYFDTQNSPLNPHANGIDHYVYGTFPMFLVKGVDSAYRSLPEPGKDMLALVGLSAPGGETKYDTTVVWGRRVTALMDTLTIVLVFLLGRALFGRPAGIVAAFLYAAAVLPTQLAHFWTMDPYVTFFAVATLWVSVVTVTAHSSTRQTWLAVSLGVLIGCGLACKVTAWPLAVVPILAFPARAAIRDFPRLGLRWKGSTLPANDHWMSDFANLCICLFIAAVVFRIAQPYAFAGPNFWDIGLDPKWKAEMLQEIDFQNGNVDFPPFVQFASRIPVLWPLQNLVLWGAGPALSIAGFGAMAVAGVLMFKRRELSYLLPIALAASILGFQGPRFVAWMRYFVPMYPVLCLFAAWAIANIVLAARNETGIFARETFVLRTGRFKQSLQTKHIRTVSVSAVFVTLLATSWWALAFQNVYSAEHPRVAASRWIYENVPAGSALTSEIWDDSLPYSLSDYPNGEYRHVETEVFAPDSENKVKELIHGWTRANNQTNPGLDGADYVVISSHRVRGAIVQLEREYPATIRYYELLDSGELGFDLVAHFETRPSLLGVTVDDSGADESFTVYDHPEVSIYKKSDRWDPERAVALLNEAHPERAINLLPRQGQFNGLQFTPEEAAIQQSGGTFSDAFDGDGWASKVPWLSWIVWLQIAAFASVPWMTWLFRRLPDRGYGLSKIAGFAGVGLITWALVAWNVVHFSGGLAWAVFALWIAVGVAVGVVRREALLADARMHWRSWVGAEVVFGLAFFAFLLIRAFNPDVWHHPQGGEKPMELAYMTAVARSTILPPFDPWFSGGTMNYYYMGWFLLSVPIRALRILPEVAFNLAIPTYAAIGATTAYSTVHNLVGLSNRARAIGSGAAEAARPYARPALFAGIFAAILLIGIGNLDGAHQTIERLQELNVKGINDAGQASVYHWSLFSDVPFLGGLVGALSGMKRVIFDGAIMPGFDWWRSSRVHLGTFDITEFPFWSLLFADLHPHLMGLPFFGLAIATGVSYVATAHAADRTRTWMFAVMLGIALGVVRSVHTWDFPAAVILVTASVTLGQVLAPGRWQTRWWHWITHLVIAAGVLTVLFAPYTGRFEVFTSGIMKAPETTKPYQYFAHFGVFLAFAVAWIAVRYWEELREAATVRAARKQVDAAALNAENAPVVVAMPSQPVAELVGIDQSLPEPSALPESAVESPVDAVDGEPGVATRRGYGFEWKNPLMAFVAGPWELGALFIFIIGLSAFTWRFGVTTLALSVIIDLFLLGLLISELKKPVRDPARIIVTGLFAAAIGIAAGTDVVVVKNDIVRMNTVFKFLLQSWQLYALASAYAAWYVGGVLWSWHGWRMTAVPGRKFAAIATTAVLAVLVFGASIFIVSGTRARQEARFVDTGPTLNGFAYFPGSGFFDDHGTPNPNDDVEIKPADDKPLIDWLRDNVEGSPVITEAVGGLYHWTGRMSWNTGLPTVIGWDWHQTQQRWDYSYLIKQRRSDTDRFYHDGDWVYAREYLQKYNVKYIVVGTMEYVYGNQAAIDKFAAMPDLVEVFRSGRYAIYEVRDLQPAVRGQ